MYKNIDEANREKLDLIEKIQSIEVQLTHRAAAIKGNRVPHKEFNEYQAWRASACHAKAKLTRRLQETKLWITEEKKNEKVTVQDDALDYLQDVHTLLLDLVSAGAEIRPDEKRLLDEVETFLLKY